MHPRGLRRAPGDHRRHASRARGCRRRLRPLASRGLIPDAPFWVPGRRIRAYSHRRSGWVRRMRILRSASPDGRLKYLEHLEHQHRMLSLVDRYGVALQGVGAGQGEPEYAHTVGLAAVGHPEFIVFGIPWNVVPTLLNPLAASVLNELATYAHGDTVHHLAAGFPVRLTTVRDSRRHLALANTFYAKAQGTRGRVAALQVVYPDPQMKWPWEAGSSVAWMPLLGKVPADAEGRVQTMPGTEGYAENSPN
jgi:hypothetical protein